ncbi:MAG: hypothetical protein Kow0010_00170 [Dehalococcoidia bacterium]
MSEMPPALRAIADRLIYDIACLKHAVTSLPRGALDEKAGGGDWNVRQVIAHLAAYAELYAGMLERRARGEPPMPDDFDIEAFHERTVEGGDARLPDLLGRLSAARDRCIAAFETVDVAALDEPFRRGTLLQTLQRWSRHVGRHGLDIVSTFATLHVDPLLLRWTLAPEFSGEEWTGATELQQRIRESAREQLTRLAED